MNNDAIRFLSASGPLIGPGFTSPTVTTGPLPDGHVLQALAAHAPFAPLPPQLYPGFGRDLKPEMLAGPPGGAIFFDPAAAAAMAAAAHPFHPYAAGLDGARRKNATRETTAPLKQWLSDHKRNPYPTKAEKIMLALLTKMTMTQVATWFANARRRLKKENKMTWSPRNRPGEDDDDDADADGDIERPLSSISVESKASAPEASSKGVSEESPAATPSDDSEEPKPKKAKIWSIADTLNCSSAESESSKSSSSASDLQLPSTSSTCSPVDLKAEESLPTTVVSPISFVSSAANPFAQQYLAMISRMPFGPPMLPASLLRPPFASAAPSAPLPMTLSAGPPRLPSASSPAASVKSEG
ncbi:hypothetical protein QR680_009700 [Steinernema hermaphroditum]|uniref:Homeobox domain-containing protein n=1 Tax=Steinernema hermaphroditum TaxID=289476 RepID=A0AA39M9D3_9BILA|nr:hypothetical protein QR680_009700 [Steinernema hermaphroditum]